MKKVCSDGKLTIVMIVKNEERYIKNSILNIKDFADKIVIFVDKTSTDNTLKIVKEFKKNCKIYIADTKGTAETLREKSIRSCDTEWVYWSDPDEFFTKELKNEIRDTIKKNPTENAFFIRRQEYFLYKPLFICKQLKLLRRKKMLSFSTNVHSEPIVEGKVKELNNILYHYSPQEIDSWMDKIKRVTIQESKKYSHLNNFSAFLNLMFFRSITHFLYNFIVNKAILSGYPGFLYSLLAGPIYSWIIYLRYFENRFKPRKNIRKLFNLN